METSYAIAPCVGRASIEIRWDHLKQVEKQVELLPATSYLLAGELHITLRQTLMCGASMAKPHAFPCDVIDVRPLAERLPVSKTCAVFKSEDLEVIRLVLMAGQSLPPHKVRGEITVHCLEGSIDVSGGSCVSRLSAGEMLFLTGGTEHAVLALEDSSALVTIALRH